MNIMNAWFPTSFLFNEEFCPDKGAALDRSLRVPCGSEDVNEHINKPSKNKPQKVILKSII